MIAYPLARRAGLNGDRSTRLDALSDDGKKLKSCGILKKIQILGPFWATDGYDSLLAQLRSMGYEEGKDLIVFDYDWRMSNFDTADLLRRKLAENDHFQHQFHIVAHSMGGIVARILLQDRSISSRVDRMVYLGTPFDGSANALATLSDGWGTFANLIAGGMTTIRQTLLSFVSIYELMPRYEACCRFGSPQDPGGLIKISSLLDQALWRNTIGYQTIIETVGVRISSQMRSSQPSD